MAQIEQQSQSSGNVVADKRVDFGYNSAGQFESIQRYADTDGLELVAESSYSYDEVGRLNGLTHLKGGTTFADYGFVWDDANRLQEFTNSQHSGESATYDYDDAGQLVNADRSGGSNDENYVYDDNGNRIETTPYTPSLGDLAESPVGAWLFGSTSTSSVLDSSGNGHTGSYTGSPTLLADMPFAAAGDRSLLLNTNMGTGDFVTLGSNLLPSDQFTVSLWFKAEDTHVGEHSAIQQVLFSQGGTDIRINYDGQLYATLTDSTDAYASLVVSAALKDEVWYNAVFRYDGTDLMVLILDTDGNYDAGNYMLYPPLGSTTPHSGTAYLGRDSAGDNYFSGEIADVRIYNVALTDEEVAVLRGLEHTYQSGANNRLVADATYDYEYDHEGNLIQRTHKTDAENPTEFDGYYTVYTWDYRNRLTAVADYDSEDYLLQETDYTYDAFNRRIAKHLDSDGDATIDRDEFYVYDGSDIVMDFVDDDGAGEGESPMLVHHYLWGPGSDQLLAQDDFDASEGETVQVLWALGDHQGSVRDYVYDAGENYTALAVHFNLDSFGNVVSGDTSGIRYIYTGQEFDAETGNYYYDARYYDPSVGRFLSEDPIGYAGDVSNVYRYVGNAATMYVDPSGLKVFRQNRKFGLVGEPVTNATALSHTFIFTTDESGEVDHTYSWGNTANTHGWNIDQPEDLKAAYLALWAHRNAYQLNQLGGDDFNQYVAQAFTNLNRKSNQHANWGVCYNCKTEATNLIEEAKRVRKERVHKLNQALKCEEQRQQEREDAAITK